METFIQFWIEEAFLKESFWDLGESYALAVGRIDVVDFGDDVSELVDECLRIDLLAILSLQSYPNCSGLEHRTEDG